MKPCPFCGSHDVEKKEGRFGLGMVRCSGCGAFVSFGTSDRAEAIAAWNRRADLPREEHTCRMEKHTNGMRAGWYVCSECGGASDAIVPGMAGPRFCGICGAKVVDE